MMKSRVPLLGVVAAVVLIASSAEAKKRNKTSSGAEQPALAVVPKRADATKVTSPPAEQTDPVAPLDEDTSYALGQDPIGGPQSGGIRMLLQARYLATRVDPARISPNPTVAEAQRGTIQEYDGYDIQRAFLRYVASPVKQVEAKFLVDFAELRHGNAKQSFKLAYVELHATRRLQIDFGLLKRPYSLLELLPIAKHELADLGATDTFIKDQGFGGRDVGAIVRIQPLPTRRMMTVSVGAYRGDIDEGFDASPLKVVGARIETHPFKHLRLGANAVWRPYDNYKMVKIDGTTNYTKTLTMKKGAAAGTDATLTYRHLEVRGELLLGKRTDPMVQDSTGKQGSFWAAWLVVAPKIEIGRVLLVPAAKVEILDTDALNANGQRRSVTGVFGIVPYNGVRILVDVTRTWIDKGEMSLSNVPWTKKKDFIYVTEPSWTSATLQAQVIF